MKPQGSDVIDVELFVDGHLGDVDGLGNLGHLLGFFILFLSFSGFSFEGFFLGTLLHLDEHALLLLVFSLGGGFGFDLFSSVSVFLLLVGSLVTVTAFVTIVSTPIKKADCLENTII